MVSKTKRHSVMDTDIEELANMEIGLQQDRIDYAKESIAELKKSIRECRKTISAIKRKKRKKCDLKKDCRFWVSCWREGKMRCGKCEMFESAEQFGKRMEAKMERINLK